jgi:membrane protease YdiL (CAAX protease family)
MNNKMIQKKSLNWMDALIVWAILLLIQILVFSLLLAYFLDITGWRFYPFFIIIGNASGVWLGVLVTEVGTLSVSILILMSYKKECLNIKELTGPDKVNTDTISLALILVPVIFLTGMLVNLIQSFFIYNPTESYIYDSIYGPKNILELLVWIGIMLTLVGPCEEFVFRGMIQKSLQNSFKEKGKSEWYAVIIGSILFAVFHLDFFKFIPILFMGFLLGYLFLKTDSSLICAISHGLYDAVSIIIIFLL